jgi:DNA-binding LacI/PurR family transcriptional regulator
VARLAGVSRATVSYVLNNRSDVTITEATRQQVLRSAQTLGYQPSPAARALRAGRGDVVLVLMPTWAEAQFGDLLGELSRLIGRHGLVCLIHESGGWEGNLQQLLARVTAAAVVTLEPLQERDAAVLERGAILEVRAWLVDTPGHPHTTAIHQADVVRAQVDHLLERGYRRLAYLAAGQPAARQFLDERVAAFEELCREYGLRTGPVALVENNLTEIETTLRTWRRRSQRSMGICTWSDATALGVVMAARQLGLAVPADIGVVGVDDAPWAELVSPAISSVRFDLSGEAANIAQKIAAALGLGTMDEASPTVHPVTVIPRAST